MAYNYEDEGGFISNGPSIGGMAALIEFVDKQQKNLYPFINKFIDDGECTSPEALQGEADRLTKKATDTDVKDTLSKLARAASQAKGKIIITH